MTQLHVPVLVVDRTLAFLQEAGSKRNSEGVVLWLGKRTSAEIVIEEAYVPEQVADRDCFRIPPASMASLLRHLGHKRTFVAAQVHSHPREAFHSRADDLWAIIRHVGAISIVLPRFAATTSVETFLAEAAVFQLSKEDKWDLVPAEGVIDFAQ